MITVSGCIYDIDEILLQREDISMTVKGAEQFVYDPVTCQLGYNEAENEFRVLDDNPHGRGRGRSQYSEESPCPGTLTYLLKSAS